jgi:hypothetical protein
VRERGVEAWRWSRERRSREAKRGRGGRGQKSECSGAAAAGAVSERLFCRARPRRRSSSTLSRRCGRTVHGFLTPRPHGSKTAFMRALFCVCARASRANLSCPPTPAARTRGGGRVGAPPRPPPGLRSRRGQHSTSQSSMHGLHTALPPRRRRTAGAWSPVFAQTFSEFSCDETVGFGTAGLTAF